MDEYALNGSFCEDCGIYLGDACGYPERCVECNERISIDELEKEFGQKIKPAVRAADSGF